MEQNGFATRRKVFISYRRADAESAAGRIADRLRRELGEDAVFLDTAAIHAGEDFPLRILTELESARAVLVVIGPNWLSATGDHFRRRIDLTDDWVRMEVARALAASAVAVVPVLVDGQDELPSREALPDELARLCERQCVVLDNGKYEQGMAPLVEILREPGATTKSLDRAAPARLDDRILTERYELIKKINDRLEKVRVNYSRMKSGKPMQIDIVAGETLLLTEVMTDLRANRALLTGGFHDLLTQRYDLIRMLWRYKDNNREWSEQIVRDDELNRQIQDQIAATFMKPDAGGL